MIALIRPDRAYLESYVEAYDETKENHVKENIFTDARACDVFLKFENYRNGRDLPPGRVGADYYWLVDDERGRFLGEICIRHELTDALLRYGGHIGYGVRPSEWGRGYGTLMLRLALEKARELGLSKILITCDDDNIASARVMEHNGLILHDKIENLVEGRTTITRRYWKIL